MKKKAMVLLLTMSISFSALQGCGRNNNEDTNDTNMKDENTLNTEEVGEDNLGTESLMENTENTTSQLQLGNAVEIPEGWEGKLGETDAHEQLEKVIAEYCNIPEENYQNVRYYYNYVDLNGDSKNEILALVIGDKVNENGGNTLLWIQAEDENITKDSVKQSFTQVGAPVYISNHMTDGYRDLIVIHDVVAAANDTENTNAEDKARTAENTSAGDKAKTTDKADNNSGTNADNADNNDNANIDGAAVTNKNNYTLLKWNKDRYQDVNEGEKLEDLKDYEGTAILTNNIENDFRTDNYHFLGEAMK